MAACGLVRQRGCKSSRDRRARSDREFAAKLQIVNEEIDESVLWLEIADAVLADPDAQVRRLEQEGIELRSIFAKARKTTRKRLKKRKDYAPGPDAGM